MNNELTLTIKTQSHDYPIVIGHSQQGFDFELSAYICGKQVLVVTNATIAPLYLDNLLDKLQGLKVATCILPDGENYKTQESINAIYDVLMQNHFGRDCTLIALGGGVIGDMTGFAAASFMRGVNFIQIPTTLLAQVDSSVGGKTGINHPLGKNMIGAFWQPVCVLADMSTFATLPRREFCAGMAEVIKYGCIMDKAFLVWLWDNKEAINRQDKQILSQMVYHCCQYKAQVVEQDEKEQGMRAWLNFGHTFGHAIETYMGYGNWLHGEAVAVGMVQAARLSALQSMIDDKDVKQLVALLKAFELPIDAPQIDVQTALDLMGHDKKVKNGKLRFVLLETMGKAVVTDNIDIKSLHHVLSTPFENFA